MRAPRGVPVVVPSQKCEQASEREGEGESTGNSVEVGSGEGDGGVGWKGWGRLTHLITLCEGYGDRERGRVGEEEGGREEEC